MQNLKSQEQEVRPYRPRSPLSINFLLNHKRTHPAKSPRCTLASNQSP